ncbi:MAG TPA: site-2 protease family protein [Vicinamibacterales bacterium]|nr:site-2 protease family protein [Vicinamibacterales bacterium]
MVDRCECGTEMGRGILACPGCGRLRYSAELKELSDRASAASRGGDLTSARAAWTQALRLLPAGSRQHAAVADRITALAPDPAAAAAQAEPQSRFWKWIVGLGPIGVAMWKLKFVLVVLLGNGKLLLLGLTKATTLLSMLLAFGVYWTAWGMWFALGLVLSIYVHEMGHVVALRRFGVAASAPMFVPGLGAFIRLRQSLPPRQNARVGLAGPLWGLGAAAAAWAATMAGGSPMWSAIAHTGAWINLFNLLPVWQLDGSRGFAALGRVHRLAIAAVFGAAWIAVGDGLLVLLAIVAAVRAFESGAPGDSDAGIGIEFGALIVALAFILRMSPVTLQ